MKVRRIIALLLLSITSITLIIFSWLDLSSIYRISRMDYGIIGGADGPTSIIVSGPGDSYILYAITVIVIIVTVILSVIYGRKKK